jgi:hypothetical protein
MPLTLGGKQVQGLVDTGAGVSIIKFRFMQDLNILYKIWSATDEPIVSGVEGRILVNYGLADVARNMRSVRFW